MRVLRAIVGVVGIAVVVGAMLVAGSSGARLAQPAVEALGNDYLVVAVPAGVGVVVVVLGLLFRGLSGIAQATPPDPEGLPRVPVLGSEFDEYAMGRPGLRSHLLADASTGMHDRVREAAIRTEMRVDGLSREEATARVDDGSWTEDGDAAAYCRPDGADGGEMRSRLRAAAKGRTWAQHGAGRAAEAIIDRSEAQDRRPVMNDGGVEAEEVDDE